MGQIGGGTYEPSREWGIWAELRLGHVGQVRSGAYGPSKEWGIWAK